MSGPAPAVAATRLAVRATLADLTPGALVLVACSGGPDSLALAAATAFVAPRLGVFAGAVIVDHGLQAGSAGVADDAGAVCAELGLDPVRIVQVRVDGGGGPEAAARAARYDALETVAAELDAVAVLLGHTLDDQAETVLLGLARGSGARSLAGMPARRGRLRRPLLGLRRADTLAACAALGLRPWHDPTNGEPDGPATVRPAVVLSEQAGTGEPVPASTQRRSAVRHGVLPALEAALGPGVAQALARTADQLREDADALDALAAALLSAARLPPSPHNSNVRTPQAQGTTECGHNEGQGSVGDVRLDTAVLSAAPDAVRYRALRAGAIEAGCPPGAVHRVHVLAVDALVTSWHGQAGVDLPGRVQAARVCGRLTFHTPQY